MADISHSAIAALNRGWVDTASGQRQIVGAINSEEVLELDRLINTFHCKNTLETGVAYGISTLAICEAVQQAGGTHIGIDPCQFFEHGGAAISLLHEYELSDIFTLLEGPTHLESPKLISQNLTFDLILIDGHHNFDYKFIDLFFANHLLKDGGILVFHDLLLQSTKKIYRFINRHLDYELLPLDYPPPRFFKKFKYVVGAVVKRRSYFWWWPNNFRNLLVLQKKSNIDHPWDFYTNF